MNDFEQEWQNYFQNRGNVATINIKSLAKHFFELGLKYGKEDKKLKKCVYCKLFRQLRYKGGETWYNYCYRDGYLNPCSGDKCDFPKYFKPINEQKKEDKK